MIKAYFSKPKRAPRILLKIPSAAMLINPVKSFARKNIPTATSTNIRKEETYETVCGFIFPIFKRYG